MTQPGFPIPSAASDTTPPARAAGEGASNDLDFDRFTHSYQAWRDATVAFEAALQRMRQGDWAARAQAQDLARELAHLHHSFLESTKPYFQGSSSSSAAP